MLSPTLDETTRDIERTLTSLLAEQIRAEMDALIVADMMDLAARIAARTAIEPSVHVPINLGRRCE